MVQTDKITGQMIMSENGTIMSSSGDLSSNEAIAPQIIGLISHTFPIAYRIPCAPPTATGAGSSKQPGSAPVPSNATSVNGSDALGGSTSPRTKRIVKTFPWKSVTVDFGSHSYVACLSNRKVHVVKREKVPAEAAVQH